MIKLLRQPAGAVLAIAIFISLTLQTCSAATPSFPDSARNAILSLTCIAENSQTGFKYNYAENIGDGRGITFGIIGFTSGTYDGTALLLQLWELAPKSPLVKYLPAFQSIDRLPHNADGLCDNTAGLENFIADFEKYGNDAAVKQAQLDKLNELYWQPALLQAHDLGLCYAISVGEIYDACVNHGFDGMKTLVATTTTQAGGTPKTGVDEKLWLNKFLDVRKAVLASDPTWLQAVDRIEMYRRILQSGNVNLTTPFPAECYGDKFTVTGVQP
ncbi:MAG: chitosanase [Bacillota bacterium]